METIFKCQINIYYRVKRIVEILIQSYVYEVQGNKKISTLAKNIMILEAELEGFEVQDHVCTL